MDKTPMPLEALTNIIHPPVLAKVEKLIETYKNDKTFSAIVLDVPLLVETGWERQCDALIFVHCDIKTRLERARSRGLESEKELKIRENFQISLDKKEQMSHYMIYNNSDLSELALQVSRIFNGIMKSS
jgi:dephospho-CoA kinase